MAYMIDGVIGLGVGHHVGCGRLGWSCDCILKAGGLDIETYIIQMAQQQKKKVELTTTIRDEEHFLTFYTEENKKLLIIDVHPAWCGPTEAMFPCYKNLQTTVVDEFEKRVDIILVDQEKLENLANDSFKATSKPKILLALEGKIIHQVRDGPNIPDLEENVKKFVPYI